MTDKVTSVTDRVTSVMTDAVTSVTEGAMSMATDRSDIGDRRGDVRHG